MTDQKKAVDLKEQTKTTRKQIEEHQKSLQELQQQNQELNQRYAAIVDEIKMLNGELRAFEKMSGDKKDK